MAEHAAVIPVRRALESIAREAGMSPPELAVRYMLSQAGITCLVVGVDTEAQMRENTALFSRGPLPSDLCARIELAVPDLPESILNPGTWSKKMAAPRLATGEPEHG
jgi:aryl-alcohol dehydrogenase-like predicted oxidoreductase